MDINRRQEKPDITAITDWLYQILTVVNDTEQPPWPYPQDSLFIFGPQLLYETILRWPNVILIGENTSGNQGMTPFHSIIKWARAIFSLVYYLSIHSAVYYRSGAAIEIMIDHLTTLKLYYVTLLCE